MDKIKMIKIDGGEYLLGNPESPQTVLHKWGPPRKVSIDSYKIAETSVTVGMYKEYLSEKFQILPGEFSHLSGQPDNLPANGLSWLDAIAYVRWIRNKTGQPYRLPTSNEWEIAARGGLINKKYPWGNAAPESKCDYALTKKELPLPVKSFPPNGYGIYDMAGNIWNWCSDLWINHTLDDLPVNAPTGLSAEINVILRGGSFMTADTGYLMCACVHEDPADLRHICLGMRLAM